MAVQQHGQHMMTTDSLPASVTKGTSTIVLPASGTLASSQAFILGRAAAATAVGGQLAPAAPVWACSKPSWLKSNTAFPTRPTFIVRAFVITHNTLRPSAWSTDSLSTS